MKRTTGDSELPADLDCLVSRIVEAAHPLRVILFGSRARGEAHPDSDADLLIVQSEADAVHRSHHHQTLSRAISNPLGPEHRPALGAARRPLIPFSATLNP